MIARLKGLYANHRNFVELKEHCGIRGFGFPKRLDEHRELVEVIANSGLLKDKPWIIGWLRTQDEFLEFCFLKLLGVGAISEAIEYGTLRQKPNYDQLEW